MWSNVVGIGWLVALQAPLALADPKCKADSIIELGNSLYYQNNVFLSSHCAEGWWSCIDYNTPETTVNYTCWPKSGPDGDDDTIKSLPYVVAGWNKGVGYKYGAGAGGLPFPARGFKGTAITSLSASHINRNPGWEMYTISYTILLSNTADLPANQHPDLQLFLYLNGNKTFGHTPVGPAVGSGEACGAKWDIHKGQGPPRQTDGKPSAGQPDDPFLTWSWKLQQLSNSLTNCDLNQILQGMEKQFPGVLPDYVIGIQGGQQVFQGDGFFKSAYSLNISTPEISPTRFFEFASLGIL